MFLDFQNILRIPGILHIVHGAVEDTIQVLSHGHEFIQQLTHVCHLLRRPWSRQRFLATCMNTFPAKAHAAMYHGFDGHVHSGRWGTITHAIQVLAPLGPSLTLAWCPPKFSFSKQSNAPKYFHGEATDLAIVTTAIGSKLFWVYINMLSLFSWVVDHCFHLGWQLLLPPWPGCVCV